MPARCMTLRERFESKVDWKSARPCWLFKNANKSSFGYGRVWANGKLDWAHRVSYSLYVGPIPAGFQIDHYRLNPGPRNAPCSRACVNPEHLEAVTKDENNRRGNSVSAQLERMDFCKRGHAFTPENSYSRPDRAERGTRQRLCQECRRERERIRYRKTRNRLAVLFSILWVTICLPKFSRADDRVIAGMRTLAGYSLLTTADHLSSQYAFSRGRFETGSIASQNYTLAMGLRTGIPTLADIGLQAVEDSKTTRGGFEVPKFSKGWRRAAKITKWTLRVGVVAGTARGVIVNTSKVK